MKNMSFVDRFFEKVEPITESGCWIWMGAIDSAGYGRMKFNGRIDGAHRVSYQLFVGAIPNKLFICHHCDVKLCVRPDHLFHGTNSDNIHDLIRKGGFRHQRATGEAHASAKLNNFLVTRMRQMYASGLYSQTTLADMFSISQSVVSSITLERIWRNLQPA